ncbi:hypothetical protein DERP_015447 [Dermatophagoides pteronyssinus]|uniref:Aspartyl-phosphate phosphatase Spo0E family protein n=1 Tax=Dermatophagoides pteronyssinus TaxID=6956 RepID=A0ABQ8J3J2_DERPT|nr:hypothetical protein DERP_015447 [Dermatophagoides pteronyssinus]
MDELDKNKQHWDNVQKQVVQLRNEIRQHIINKSTVLHKSIDEQPHSNEVILLVHKSLDINKHFFTHNRCRRFMK